MLVAVVPLLVVVTILGVAGWVYSDARRRADQGLPVVYDGFVTIDTPGAWCAGCIVVWIVVLPLYLAARGAR